MTTLGPGGRADDHEAPTIGLDIGGTNIRGCVVARDGTVLAEHRVPVPRTDTEFDGAMAGVVHELRRAHPDVGAVGVGIAGLVDDDGVMHYGPNLADVFDLPVRAVLERATGLPVVVDNDANVAGYGEVVHGAACGARNALMVTLGTGIGGAIIADGRIYRGAHGFAAEFGHFQVDPDGPMCACGERGHWEAIASGTALGRMARELVACGKGRAILDAAGGDVEAVDGPAVGIAALAGDAEARALLEQFGDNVAIGLVALTNILDPELIVISGGLVELGALLFEPLGASFTSRLEGAAHRPIVGLLPATLGERAGVIGAAALARTLL
jgi:glucokinase